MELAGNVFVVTGGGNGIGRDVALGLLARGARVAAADLSAEGLAETQRLAGDAGDRLSLHELNVADREAVEALPTAVTKAHGQVDGVVNVAGIVHRFAHVEQLSYEELERVMDVNFWGTMNMVKAFLPGLRERPAASLVNVSSMGALVPVPGQGAYGASKAAVKLLTEGLYAELRGTTVAVTVVFPGGVGTDILGNSGVTRMGSMDAASSSQKLTTPQDAAAQIIRAIERGDFRVRIGGDARLLDRLARLMPTKAITMIADKMKSLLAAD